jgi:hypothetical protein
VILRESQFEEAHGRDSGPTAREGDSAYLRDLRPPTRGVEWLICGLFAAIVTACILHYSSRHGRLSLVPQYDDVGYMADGARRLQTLYDHGIPGFFRQYLAHPPHSPYSDLLAMAAFAVLGIRDWAPYAANFLLAFGLFASVNYLLAGVRVWQKIGCFLLLASIPFVGVSVHEFRPDPCVAWLTAMGIMLALVKPLVGASRRHQLAVGACFGAAMLVKPPFFPATVAFFVGTLVLATVRDFVAARRISLREAAWAWLTCLGPFVLISLPHYLVAHRQIWEYIDYNMFGGHAALWRHRATLHDTLVYYGTGPGGQFTLGSHVYLLLGIWAVLAIAFGIRRRREEYATGLTMGFALCMVYAQPTLNLIKSVYFGMTFPILLAFVVLYWLGRLLVIEQERFPRRWFTWASILLLIVTAGGVWLFQWPTRYGTANDPSVTARNAIVHDVYRDVLAHTMLPSAGWVTQDDRAPIGGKIVSAEPRVVLTGIGDLNADYLNYISLRDRTMARWISPVDTDQPATYYQAFDDADFIIANESGTGIMADFLLNGKIQDQLLAAVRSRGDFRQIGRYTFNRTGRSLYLFQRVYFEGFTPMSGLGPTEGPYDEFDGHAVRWGFSPATTLRIDAPAAGVYQLSWWARNRVPGQTITIVLDGRVIKRVTIAEGGAFTKTRLSLALAGGLHQLELQYSVSEAGTRKLAVLFKELRIAHE